MDTAVLPEVRRVGSLIGAEIRGLDLTRDHPDETGMGPTRRSPQPPSTTRQKGRCIQSCG